MSIGLTAPLSLSYNSHIRKSRRRCKMKETKKTLASNSIRKIHSVFTHTHTPAKSMCEIVCVSVSWCSLCNVLDLVRVIYVYKLHYVERVHFHVLHQNSDPFTFHAPNIHTYLYILYLVSKFICVGHLFLYSLSLYRHCRVLFVFIDMFEIVNDMQLCMKLISS